MIAGTPDADDLRHLQGAVQELGKNDNLQININKDISNKVNELVKIVNKTPLIKIESGINSLHIINQIQQIKNRIEAIQDAIFLAKKQLVSHRLLTIEEIYLIADTMMKAGIHLEIPEQGLSIIITAGNNLNYILTIPKVKHSSYSK